MKNNEIKTYEFNPEEYGFGLITLDELKSDDIESNTKAAKILKWHPKYSGLKGFKKGLEKTINWFSEPKNLKYYNSDIYNI